MAYTKVNWENSPSTNTPINNTNLNHMDQGIYDNSEIVETVGDVSDLKTENKNSVVDAINEIKDYNEYSTSNEINTGEKWVDGKDIYKKTYHFNPSSSGEVSFTFDSTGMDSVWIDKTHTFLIRSNGVVMQGFGDPTNTGYLFDSRAISKSGNVLMFYIGSSIYSSSNLYVTINYTKS